MPWGRGFSASLFRFICCQSIILAALSASADRAAATDGLILHLSKTASPTTYTGAGQTINYTYVISEPSPGSPLVAGIVLTDDKVTGISCPNNFVPADGSMTCTGSYTTTEADVAAGSVTNLATVTGIIDDTIPDKATATATIMLQAQPSWTLAKTASPATFTAAGQSIDYSYKLTNTGNVSISGIAVADDKVTTVNCPATTLAIGANMTCTGSYTTTAADVTAQKVTNNASATGTPASGTLAAATANATVTLAVAPSWTLAKTASPGTFTAAGQAIDYSYKLTNTGNVAISAIAIADNKVATVSCPANSLAVGASMICTGSYTTTKANVRNGSVTNRATATGTPASGTLAPATATATVTYAVAPAWTLTKTASPATFTAAGQVIDYTYRLTNTGNVAISAIAIVDNKVATVNCPSASLAIGASMTCTGSYTITKANVRNGSLSNRAVATGTPASGTLGKATASATVTLKASPSWTLVKTASPTTFTAAGQSISYSYRLANTGNVAISAITLTDTKVASVSCPSTALAAGRRMICTGSYTATAADVKAGKITSTGTASGTPAFGTLRSVSATATVTLAAPASGSITIVATASGGNATFGFTSTLAAAPTLTLTTASGRASRRFTGLKSGTYLFTEASLPLDWTLVSLSCSGDSGGRPTTVDLSARKATIGLDGGEAIVCTFGNGFAKGTHVKKTREVINAFLTHRIDLLADQQPDRARFIRRIPGSLWGDTGFGGSNAGQPFSFSGYSDPLTTQMSFATSLSQIAQAYADSDGRNASASAVPGKAPREIVRPAFDLWMEGHFSSYRASAGPDADNGRFGLLYLGADYLVTPSTLVGALVQFDWTGENSASGGTSASGRGWMAGPYVSVRLQDNIFFDARAAWGTSANSVSPFNTYSDDFSTRRWLAHANLTGNWHWDHFRITPSVGFTYIAENQHSYIDTLGALIPAQTVALGRLSFGPEFGYRWAAADGSIYEPMLSITGEWDAIKSGVTQIAGISVAPESIYARVQAGVMSRSPSGFNLRATVSYDGLGSSSFHDIGGQVWLSVPFH